MPINGILPFATGAGANVLLDQDYATSPEIGQGVQDGVADPKAANKAWRQSSVVASGIGQFGTDFSGQDFTDSLAPAAIRDLLRSAMVEALAAASYGVDTSSQPNSLIVSLTPAPVTLTGFRSIDVRVANTSTAAVTLALNSFPIKNVLSRSGNPLQAGDLVQGQVCRLYYDGAAFRVSSSVASDAASSNVVASAKAPFNVQEFVNSTRVSMSGVGTIRAINSGWTFTKQSATSDLLIFLTGQSFIAPGTPYSAATLTLNVGAASVTGLTDQASFTFGGGDTLIRRILASAVTTGPLAITLDYSRADSVTWQTVFNPSFSDYGCYPASTATHLIVMEKEP